MTRTKTEPRQASVLLVLSSVCTILTLTAAILCVIVGVLLRQNMDNAPSNRTLKIIVPVFVALFIMFLTVTLVLLFTARKEGTARERQTDNIEDAVEKVYTP